MEDRASFSGIFSIFKCNSMFEYRSLVSALFICQETPLSKSFRLQSLAIDNSPFPSRCLGNHQTPLSLARSFLAYKFCSCLKPCKGNTEVYKSIDRSDKIAAEYCTYFKSCPEYKRFLPLYKDGSIPVIFAFHFYPLGKIIL